VGSGADAQAVAYLELRIGDAVTLFGVGIDSHIVLASLKAIVSGVQREQSNKAENTSISATA
jgi:2-isopropylmalate synthase